MPPLTTVAPDINLGAAEGKFAIAAYALLANGANNFDLIKIVRIQAAKVKEARAKQASDIAAAEEKPAPKARDLHN
jgi:hypothetical protein